MTYGRINLSWQLDTSDDDLQHKLYTAFDAQMQACEALGSPLTACIVKFLRDDFAANGIIDKLVRGWPGDPLNDNVPLRLAGFVQFMALGGHPVKRFFASCNGHFETGDDAALGRDLRALFIEREADARLFLQRIPQTNEPARAALLLIGFSQIARLGLPLRLREMGASAGLNLFFDRFRYALETDKGPLDWGPPDSPLVIRSRWRGTAPALLDTIDISDRRGCDLAPVDLTDAVENRALQSWIWGDMSERRARLMAALSIAQTASVVDAVVDKADAADWVAAQILNRPVGQTTVLYHSIVWPYLSAAQGFAIESAFAQAGENVTPDAPLAWLQMDSRELSQIPYLSYRIWTGENGSDGERVDIGSCHPHGTEIDIKHRF